MVHTVLWIIRTHTNREKERERERESEIETDRQTDWQAGEKESKWISET